MAEVVYFRGNRQQARDLVRAMKGMLTGQSPDTLGIARGVFLSVGFAALGDIRRDFIVKSRGGTGEDGVKWDALKPATIAARRVGAKDRKLEHIAARLAAEKSAREAAKAARKAEVEAWKATTANRKAAAKDRVAAVKARKARIVESGKKRLKELDKELRPLINRYKLSLQDDEAVARAKQILAARKAVLKDQIAAEIQAVSPAAPFRPLKPLPKANISLRAKFAVTKATGQSRISVFANRDVEILKDTGVGLASLSQGELSARGPGATYTKPTSPAKTERGEAIREGGGQQVFEAMQDGIIVGTNVPYMVEHQNGNPAKNLPARPFLPKRVPPAWAKRWAEAGLEALTAGARMLFQAG
jgi:hypothetical protein